MTKARSALRMCRALGLREGPMLKPIARAALCVAACLFAATPAAASTIDIEANPILGGQAVVYRAAPGEVNNFFPLGQTGDQLGFQDGFGAVSITLVAP